MAEWPARNVGFVRHSGKAADVERGGTANRTNVLRWPCLNKANEKWTFSKTGDGSYEIKGGRRQAPGGRGSLPRRRRQRGHLGGPQRRQQHWALTPTGDGHYFIINRYSGLCLAVDEGSTADGATITGSYGAELARYLRANEMTLVEVDRPDRRARRAAGKSDPVDAYAAATAVLSGRANGTPKDRDGTVAAIRAPRVVRASAIKARTQTINQLKSLITAPAATREALRSLTTTELIRRLVASRSAPI